MIFLYQIDLYIKQLFLRIQCLNPYKKSSNFSHFFFISKTITKAKISPKNQNGISHFVPPKEKVHFGIHFDPRHATILIYKFSISNIST